VGPRNHVLDGSADPPWDGAILGERGIPLQNIGTLYTVVCAKTAEPIGMPFGLWARIGRRNHVLDGGPPVLRDVATATNFWLSMGYNFGRRMIPSDTLFDSLWVGFGVKLSDEDIAEIECLSVVAMARPWQAILGLKLL